MLNSIEKEYFDAERQWLENNEGESDPAFWEVGFVPTDAAVSQAVRVVSRAIHEHRNCDPQTATITLFYLIRSKLSDIRINYLWPEVARVLKNDEFQPTPAVCGNFFRDILRKFTRQSIPNVHNPYVAFCLDQTAVGPDRTQIVLEFFEFLLQCIVDGDQDRTAAVEVSAICDQFISQSMERDRVEVYRIQLERNGRTIVNLIRELRSGNIFHEAEFWNWESLRQWWKEHSGEDLNRLTSEIRDALQSIITRVEDSLTRHSLVAFVQKHQGNVSILFPDRETRSIDSINSCPLGPIRVKLGAVQRDLQLRDSFGLTGNLIASKSSECWHGHKSHAVFAWRQKPFQVNRSGTTIAAKPFYEGGAAETAFLRGFYYAAECDDGHVPEVIGVKFSRNLIPRYSLSYEWKLKKDGFCAKLGAIFTTFPAENVVGTLSFGDEILWEGEIKGKFTRLGENCSFNSSDFLEVKLLDHHKDPLKVFSLHPPEVAFVAVDGVVQKHQYLALPKVINGGAFTSGIVLGIQKQELPTGIGCSLKEMGTPLSYSGWTFYRVTPEVNTAFFQISASHFKWEFESGSPISLTKSNQCVNLKNGISVTKVRDCIPFQLTDQIHFRLVRFADRQPPAKGFRLILTTSAGQRFRWNISQLSSLVNEHGDLSLKQLFRKIGYDLPIGHLSVFCEKPGVGLTEPIRIFRIPDDIEVQPCRTGEISKLRMISGDQEFTVTSPDVISSDLRNCQSKVEGWFTNEHGGIVRFEWPVNVVDAVLLDQGKISTLSNIMSSDIERFSLLNVSTSKKLNLKLAQSVFELEAGQLERLSDLVPKVIDSTKVTGNSIQITAVADEPLRSWVVDVTPSAVDIEMNWSLENETKFLELKGSLRGNPNGLNFQLVTHHNLEIASGTVDIVKLFDGRLLKYRFSKRFAIPEDILSLLDPDEPGLVLVKFTDETIARHQIPGFASSPESFDLKNEIKNLVRSLGNSVAFDDLKLVKIVSLIEQFFREEEKLPFNSLDSLASDLTEYGSVECRAHAASCLRLLKNLECDKRGQMFDIRWQSDTPLRLMMVSLAAVYQKKLHRLGLADPRITETLEHALEFLVTESVSEKEKYWSREILDYLMTDSIRSTSDGSPVLEHFRLIGFDADLNDFLEKNSSNGDDCERE